jgi:mono/diheme cytochrome c family protein
MHKLMRTVRLALLASVMIALAFTLASVAQERPATTLDQAATASIFRPDQGWSQDDRLRYYFTSQGSAAIAYDIFLNLEAANNQSLFRADENLAGYGFVPHPADPTYNPNGLPIGVAKTEMADGPWKGKWVGLTCAACHNGQLEYKGTQIRISGGNNNTIDFHTFIDGLDDALVATVADPQKFDRLAERLEQRSAADKQALRQRLEQDKTAVNGYRDVLAVTPTVVGPGRMDALRLIHNQVQSRWLDMPQNWVAPLAPAKPSFVWNVPQSAWAQWSGILPDPILRNQGESLGVFARMDLTSETPAQGLFDSTVDLRGQIASEDLLRRLAPPPWPEEILGQLDQEKVAQGGQLFAQNCASCHSTWPHRWSEAKKQGKRFIENAIVSVGVVGTDPGQFSSPQFESSPTTKPGRMSEYLPPPNTGATLAPPSDVFGAIMDGIYDKAMAKLNLSEEEVLAAHGYRASYPEPVEPIPALGAYKANPIEGMWSAPPFLHNGSVPNLYELLSPASDRSKTFFIGREFDPVKVGVDTSGNSGKFLFDTSLIGNSNAGHSFENATGKGVIGRLLTEDERWALIEYVKSVPNQPQQITPFGGPSNPIRAWQDPTFFHVQNPGTYNGAPQLTPVSAAPNTPIAESIPDKIATMRNEP